jgi:hypothetical protein
VQIWHILDVEEVDIYEVILLAVNCHLPDWRREAVHNWSPIAPRPLRGVWVGTGAGQGQLRLRGALTPQHTATHTSYARRMHLVADRLLMSGNRGADITCRKELSVASEKKRSG